MKTLITYSTKTGCIDPDYQKKRLWENSYGTLF